MAEGDPPSGDPTPPPGDPPKGDPPKGDPSGQPDPKGKESADELRSALELERRNHKDTLSRLTKLEKDRMTEQEKAVAEAKKQGHDEALLVAGKRLAAAEFRAAAAGRISDPAAALDVLDLSKFVGEDGEPDAKAIASVVEKLAVSLPLPNGRVPAGPRGGTDPPGDQWLRDSIVRS
jgi:hypothetical protein